MFLNIKGKLINFSKFHTVEVYDDRTIVCKAYREAPYYINCNNRLERDQTWFYLLNKLNEHPN